MRCRGSLPVRGAGLALLATGLLLPPTAALEPRTPQDAPASKTPQIQTETFPDATVGKAYQVRLRTDGGREPYRWALRTGFLPEGMELDESTGDISGTPTVADLLNFTIAVTDSSSPPQTNLRYFTLNVAEPLELDAQLLPAPTVQSRYRTRLFATGGTPPLDWQVVEGRLPRGLALDFETGWLTGTPAEGGDFSFSVRVSDAGRPAQIDTRVFTANVTIPLAVEWARPPRPEDGGIYGSLRVSNGISENLALTVIVLAVNEVGKAFALGYYRFILEGDTETVELAFGFALPEGSSVVHADAVAEAPPATIFRARLESGALRID